MQNLEATLPSSISLTTPDNDTPLPILDNRLIGPIHNMLIRPHGWQMKTALWGRRELQVLRYSKYSFQNSRHQTMQNYKGQRAGICAESLPILAIDLTTTYHS